MDKTQAEGLIEELSKHSGIIRPDKDLFLDILVSTYVPESSGFYEDLPDREQFSREADRYSFLSLRRVLRNKNAKDSKLTKWKEFAEAIASTLGIYSSDIMTRRLRADSAVVEMMTESKHSYSLLGKFKTHDFSNPDATFIVTKPILVIPDADNTKILEWENTNSIYEKETGILFKHLKRIKAEEYLI